MIPPITPPVIVLLAVDREDPDLDSVLTGKFGVTSACVGVIVSGHESVFSSSMTLYNKIYLTE
jgi:hypothetical protein